MAEDLAIYDGALRKACLFFGVGDFVAAMPAPHGRTHKSFFVTAANGEKYVARIMSKPNAVSLANGVSVQRQLSMNNIPTSQNIKSTDGRYACDSKHGYITLSLMIQGKRPEPILESCYKIGAVLAKYHKFVVDLPHKNSRGSLLLKKKYSFRIKKEKDVRRRERLLSLYCALGDIDALPTGICHCDLHLANLLVMKQGVIALLDHDNSRKAPYALDIARSIIDICRDGDSMDWKKANAYLEGYETQRRLTLNEKIALRDCMAYSAGAVAAWFSEKGDYQMSDTFLELGEESTSNNIGVAPFQRTEFLLN